MKKILLGFFGLAMLGLLGTLAFRAALAVNANPLPGSVWTWLGPTFGADWVAPSPSGTPNVIFYGADPTGATDSAPAFMNACTQNPGRDIYVPAGVYLWNTSETFSIICSFHGDGTSDFIASPSRGSYIKITNPAISPITFTGEANGSRWARIGFFQNQPTPGPGWAPTLYNPIITENTVNGEILLEDMMFLGIDKGVSSSNSGRLTSRGFHGQCFTYCIKIDTAFDVTRFDDVHIWPYWSQDSNVVTYQQANTDAIITLRNDTPQWGRIFVWGTRSGLKFDSSSLGSTSGCSIDSLDTDNVKYGIWVVANGIDCRIATAFLAGGGGAIANADGLHIDGQGGILQFGEIRIFGTSCYAINLANTVSGNTIRIGSIFMANIGQYTPACPGQTTAIKIAGINSINSHALEIATVPVLNASAPFNLLDPTVNFRGRIPQVDSYVYTSVNNGTYKILNSGPGTTYLYNNVSAVNGATIIFPQSYPGEEVTITSNQTITGVTFQNFALDPSWGILDVPTSLSPHVSVKFKFLANGPLSAGFWARLL